MSRPGRVPVLQQLTYVLTGREVAQLYFRRGEDYVKTGQIWRDHPTFPRPTMDLFHRRQVEAWVDLLFGIKADSDRALRQARMLEEAKRGTGQSATRSDH